MVRALKWRAGLQTLSTSHNAIEYENNHRLRLVVCDTRRIEDYKVAYIHVSLSFQRI